MLLKSLTYTSRASLDLTANDLMDIHQSARHLNALDGITGLLMFDGTRFLQIIEGPEEAIDSLVDRLRMDHRHGSLEIRDERFVEERSFAGWSMELVNVSPGFIDTPVEIGSILPASTTDQVRHLVLKMSADMARDVHS